MLRRPYGPTAWWVEDVADPAAWAAGLQQSRTIPDAIVDVLPAEDSVVVRCAAGALDAVGEFLDGVRPSEVDSSIAPVDVPVVYDGSDLAQVAEHAGLSVDDVVERHAAGDYRVAFCGFSPGFAYMTGLDPTLEVPRRTHPRTRVPAGSVAIAAHYAAVYPSASPGGWHLLGHTERIVWNTAAASPALLRPGIPVRFRPI
ncbi:MAG: allophanate hydrolase subunit 1 [Actinomycetota bacterium]